MSWTYSYPIPLDSTNTEYSYIRSGSHGSNIYIITDTALEGIRANRMEIFVFNIKTTEFRTVSYDVPEYFGDWITSVEKDDNNIYIWRDCVSTSESLLFKFDISTDSLTHIVSVAERRDRRRCPIIGDQMYAFAYDLNNTLHLLTIDLSKGELVSKTFLINTKLEGRNQYMIAKNNQLYMLDIISNNERKVYKIVNGELSLVSHKHFNDDGDIDQLTTWNGELDYKKTTENGTVFYTDKFDFEKLTWSRDVLKDSPWSCSDVERIQSDLPIDGVRYVIKHRLGSECAEYDMQVFENLPKLSTQCYLNIVDEVIQQDYYVELKNVKNMLHPLMSYELDELTNWKRREKEIITAENELKVTQLNVMTEEIILMENEMIIDSEMSKALFDVFNPSSISEI